MRELAEAVKRIDGSIDTEASGNVTLATVSELRVKLS